MRILTLSVTVVLLLVGFGYWRSNSVPSRPEAVPSTAVFLSAPNVGFPTLPRGRWLACSENNRSRSEHCVITSRDGVTEYQGIFVQYTSSGAADHGQIDVERTREANIWIRGALVPIVHMKDGSLLIPVEGYEQALRYLRDRKAN